MHLCCGYCEGGGNQHQFFIRAFSVSEQDGQVVINLFHIPFQVETYTESWCQPEKCLHPRNLDGVLSMLDAGNNSSVMFLLHCFAAVV